MKLSAKLIASILSIALLLPVCLVGCGGPGEEVVDQERKDVTVLRVVNYGGGFGEEWLNAVEKRFEAAYATTSFEPGKTGIDIKIDHNKDQGQDYINKTEAQPYHVYFPGNIYYHEWVSAGKMLDITDVIEEVIEADGESILDKMTAAEKDFYSVDGKYYAIPHHNSQPGLVYDKDLFAEKGLYFAKNGAPSEDYALDKDTAGAFSGTVAYTGNGEKSAGPDGKHGTSDDGLPATYDEFFILCEYMTTPAKSVTPFIWTGKTLDYYTNLLLAALAADYEGSELALQYSYNGTATHLVDSINADGTVNFKAPTTITEDNGYEVYGSAGRYYALTFVEKILSNQKFYDTNICFGGTSNLEVQYKYILGKEDDEKFAFMVEGNWWENEATDSFDKAVKYYDDSFAKENRNFAFLPLPKATTDQIGQASTLTTTEASLGFIKASCETSKIDAAKTFLKFCYTDESLNEFTATTGIPAALQYEIDADVYNSLSSFGKSLCDVKNNVVSPYSASNIHKNNYQNSILMFTFKSSYGVAVNALRDGKTAAEVFNAIRSNYTATTWESSFGKYYK